MGTNTMFYLADLVKYDNIPVFWKNCPIGDSPLALFLASKGIVGYIDEVMSVHRVLVPGSWTAKQQNINNQRKHHSAMLKMYDEYDVYTEYKYHDIIKKKKRNMIKYRIRKEIGYIIRKILSTMRVP